ncbi:LTA synthase family protein [Ruminococcus flavefaciens]|uniref:LTA synthase family protein n=1 Tax=Ruminococcus flavefaciens TaxID=1265 RepID=UPI0026E99D93|nr:alkaline phosphatase family protein [Ruminococcus flavefaciens]MDD7516396.1 sulfatase-like hydrolase/transferase [Ruminococcus flavefaciens]MDY5691078.1 sulfatase-like hydrolase/transferase [Ruminococcus flavefaciens]
MTKKSNNGTVLSEEKTESTLMRDVSDPIEAAIAPSEPKKTRFPKLKKFNELRDKNTTKYSKLNTFLMVIFPLFICCMAEITQSKYISSFVALVTERPTVFIFDLIITAVVFAFLLGLFKKGWIAVLIHTIIFMALSTTELFKYGTNGNHLILSDMKLFRSVKSLTSFAYIKITPRLILYYIIAIAFVLLVFYLNPKIKASPVRRVTISCACLLPMAALIVLPGFYNPVYKTFKLDTTDATNTFILNEKFDKNHFLAFLVQTASESYANRLVVPEDYSEEYIQQIMNIPVDTSEDFNGGKKPNVIVIMSESYADFRVFDKLDIDKKCYKYFDKAISEGKGGIAITPTYASWTVRSEFELLFGLPVRGLNTPNMPQRELADREQPALAQYYKSWGYETVYVHPFRSGFYSRSKIYGHFGFEKMIYHDDQSGTTDFTVPVDHFGTYVDDSTVYNQILDEIKTSDRPIYLHTTTMQNHQPYNQGDDPDDEFGNYLTWVQHSNEGLDRFLSELKDIDEPTIVFFVGDHFPSLRGETSVYNQLGLSGENCTPLYQQKYFFWSNYDADFSYVPEKETSFFYMPYVILNIIDAPRDAFIEKMNDYMNTLPVYSSEYNSDIPRNEELDIITIDRVIMEEFSPSPIPDDELSTHN